MGFTIEQFKHVVEETLAELEAATAPDLAAIAQMEALLEGLP